MNMENMTYTVVKAGSENGIGGIMGIPPEASGAPPQWGAYVTVDNVDQTARAAESLGGKIMMAPRDIPRVGRFAVIQDPQGAVISLITYSLDQDGDNAALNSAPPPKKAFTYPWALSNVLSRLNIGTRTVWVHRHPFSPPTIDQPNPQS